MSHNSKTASIIALYQHPEGVRRSVRKLKKYRFDLKKISIAARGYHPCATLFMISGFGPLSVSGPLATAIIRALCQRASAGSLAALHEGLYRIGIPKEKILEYVSVLKKGTCLLCVQGPVKEVAELGQMLARSKAVKISDPYQ